jgi:tetratricopeptide (TPR) repeat protein
MKRNGTVDRGALSAARAVLVFAACAAALSAGFWGCAKEAREPEDKVYLHKTAEGETLADIAEEYYGNPSRASFIGEFNGISGEERVAPGTVLRVPMTLEDLDRMKTREQADGPYNEGLALAEKASYIDAMEKFREAVALDPGFADARYNLGVCLYMVKSYEKSKEELERAVELRPKNPKYLFALGNSLFHLDDVAEAAATFEGVIELQPSNAKAVYSLAVCYEKLGEKDKAIAAWKRYLALDSSSAWGIEAKKRLDALE